VALAILLRGKDYYAAAIYPTLFAGGAVWMESKMKRWGSRAAYTAALAIVALLLAPFAVPLLPVQTYIRYAEALHSAPSASSSENLETGVLPQLYADMFGWREMAERVAAIYNGLPPEDREKAVFFGRNYGEAAAIDVFGQPLGLPPAISGHNTYFLWGPRGHDGSVVIVVGGDRAALLKGYREVTAAGRVDSPYAMPYETNLPIYVLRGLKVPFDWPSLKHYE